MTASEKRLHAVAINRARRHLTDAQQVRLGMAIKPDLEERARQSAAGARSPTAPGRSAPGDAERQAQRSSDEVAQAVGLKAGRTFERGEQTIRWAATGYSYSALNSARWVSSRIEDVRRRTSLPWSHHEAVAALELGARSPTA